MKKVFLISTILLLLSFSINGQIPVQLKQFKGFIMFEPLDNYEHPNICRVGVHDSSLYIKYCNSSLWYKYALSGGTQLGSEYISVITDKNGSEGLFDFISITEDNITTYSVSMTLPTPSGDNEKIFFDVKVIRL